MHRILVSSVLVCLLLAPAAAASSLTAASIETEGTSSIEGAMVAVTTGMRSDGSWTIGSLEASAARVHAVVERTPPSYTVAGASVGAQQERETAARDFEQASLHWSRGGTDAFLMAWTVEGAVVSAESVGLHVAPSDTASVAEPLKRGGTDGVTLQVDGTYEVAGAVQTIVIRGDVRLAVRDVRFSVTHKEGEDEIDTLFRQEEPVPGVPAQRSQAAYGYLVLEDAVLTLHPVGAMPEGSLFVDNPRLEAGSMLTARQAQGVAFGMPVGKAGPVDARFYGLVTAEFGAPEAGKAIAVLSGDPASIVVAGHAVLPGERPAWALWASTVGLLLLFAAGGWMTTPTHRVRRLERRLGHGDMVGVARTGPRLFHTRAGDRARLAVTVALLRQRQARSALEVLRGAHAVTAPTRLLLEAQAAAILDDPHTARAKAEACLRLAPTMQRQMLAMADLAPLLREGGGYA